MFRERKRNFKYTLSSEDKSFFTNHCWLLATDGVSCYILPPWASFVRGSLLKSEWRLHSFDSVPFIPSMHCQERFMYLFFYLYHIWSFFVSLMYMLHSQRISNSQFFVVCCVNGVSIFPCWKVSLCWPDRHPIFLNIQKGHLDISFQLFDVF